MPDGSDMNAKHQEKQINADLDHFLRRCYQRDKPGSVQDEARGNDPGSEIYRNNQPEDQGRK
jgi:hypothetical protein